MSEEHDKTMNEISLLNFRLTDLQATIEAESARTRDAMPEAIRQIVTDEQTMARFWAAAFDSLQSAAQRHTGQILVTGLMALLKRSMLFIALGLIVYSIGGWSALLKLWAAIWNQG